MHPLVRFLRIALPIAFAGFVALIAISFSRAQFTERKTDESPTRIDIRPEDNPSLVMDAFEDTHTVGGRLLSRIRAVRTIGFESGWFALESVELALFSENGVQYTVSAGQAQFNPETKEAEATGGVTVSSSEGLSISTERVRFDGEHVTNRLPVDFEVAGWAGHAGRIRLRVADETLYLLDGVSATLSPHDGEQRVDLASESATSFQRTGELVFEGSVRVERRSEVLLSEVLRVGTDPDTRDLTGLAGEGNVLIRMLKGSSLVSTSSDETLGAGETRIRADRFTGEVAADSTIRALNIIGEQLPVSAIMDTIPRREMTTSNLRVELTPGGGIVSLHATGRSSVQELGSAPRVIEADDLRVSFDPATREPSGAIFKGNVLFRDKEGEGRAPQAVYDIKGDRVTLTSADNVAPTLETSGTLLKAGSIDVSPRAGTVRGTGQVVVRYDADSDSGAADSVLFGDSKEPLFVNADSMYAVESSGVVTFSGAVKVWQNQNSIFATEVQIVRDGEQVTGTGSVRIVLRQRAEDGTVQSINARADSMSATREPGRVQLEGAVEIEEAGRTLSSDQALFIFDSSNRIERMEATGNVVVEEAGTGRSARGDTATYRVAQRNLRIRGNPAILADASGEIRGAEILFDTLTQKVEVIGGEATYNPEPK
jgi:lipopolysaccharide transport protein LptA